MIRTGIVGAVVTAGLLLASPGAAAVPGRAAQSAAPLTAAEAAPFLGEWILTLEGERGPATMDLNVKTEKERVVGDITGATGTPQPISDIKKSQNSLLLSYSFDYEGSPVDAVVQLTPAVEGGMKAEIAFAGGAYVMSGTAAKKPKTK